jgi:cytochrome c1
MEHRFIDYYSGFEQDWGHYLGAIQWRGYRVGKFYLPRCRATSRQEIPRGLHDLIRNPKTVRTWPAQAMPALSDYLSDREVELIIAYLKHMADRKQGR